MVGLHKLNLPEHRAQPIETDDWRKESKDVVCEEGIENSLSRNETSAKFVVFAIYNIMTFTRSCMLNFHPTRSASHKSCIVPERGTMYMQKSGICKTTCIEAIINKTLGMQEVTTNVIFNPLTTTQTNYVTSVSIQQILRFWISYCFWLTAT